MLSSEFAVNHFFMKLFRTSSIVIVKQWLEYFAFEIPNVLWAKRANNFKNKSKNTNNIFCKYLSWLICLDYCYVFVIFVYYLLRLLCFIMGQLHQR